MGVSTVISRTVDINFIGKEMVRDRIKGLTLAFGAILFSLCPAALQGQQVQKLHLLTLARLKYKGGGDWYNDPSVIPNLAREINRRTTIRVNEQQAVVEINSPELFQYPILYLTGHGNIVFSPQEVKRLRLYLTHGGFLYADDDYGMDKAFRREIKKVFPNKDLVELPADFPIYHCFYDFPHGLPKIHKHNGKPPQGFGIFDQGRLVVFYTYETDISDGWASPEVHGDPPQKREAAFRMGINIIVYALTH